MRKWRSHQYFLEKSSKLSTLNKTVFEELNVGLKTLHASQIWLDPIPQDPDEAVRLNVAACLDYVTVLDESVDNNRGWKPATPVPPLIPPSFGKLYTVVVRDASDKKIPDGHDIKPTIYYENGYLIFESDPTKYFQPPFRVTGYAYVGRTLADYTGAPQLYPLGALAIPSGTGWLLQVSFIDSSRQVAYVNVYSQEGDNLRLIARDIPV